MSHTEKLYSRHHWVSGLVAMVTTSHLKCWIFKWIKKIKIKKTGSDSECMINDTTEVLRRELFFIQL